MREKNIKSVIQKKFNSFLMSIEDKDVRKLVRENTIVTGGCIASMLMGEEVNDFDMYFRDKKTVKAVAKYYVDQFKKSHPENILVDGIEIVDGEDHKGYEGNKFKAGFRYLNLTEDRIKIVVPSKGIAGEMQEKDVENNATLEEYLTEINEVDKLAADLLEKTVPGKYRPVFLSSNAITLKDKVQLIIRFYGDPAEIHGNYDYVHCMNYWTSWENELVLNPEALKSILAKELIYVNSRYPIASIIRSRKFLARGWTINAGQYLKMCFAVSKLDLTDIAVLEDQLVGVDTAYFSMLISILASKLDSKPDEKLDETYIITIIDKIF